MRYEWPDGNRCALVLSFDFDAESAYVRRNPEAAATRLDGIEERRFGPRTGVPRILRLLERYQLPATFYVPAFTIEHYPEAVRSIRDAGHELGAHGDVHEALEDLDEAEERAVLRRQLQVFETHLQLRPLGYRAPSWSVNNRTPALLKEAGFLYDSSLMGDDIPYLLETPHGPLAEVPVQWLLDDAPFYRHVYGSTNGIAEPDRVIALWLQEFRAMRVENGCLVLCMHPWISGRAGRLDGLERFIAAVLDYEGVWITTALAVAQWQIETGQNAAVRVVTP